MTAAHDNEPPPRSSEHTAEFGPLAEELRLFAVALLDRYEPGVRSVLAGLRVEAQQAAAEPVTAPTESQCPQWCPICSALALARGDRPELGGRIAEHADSLLTVLRAVLQPAPGHAEPPRTGGGC